MIELAQLCFRVQKKVCSGVLRPVDTVSSSEDDPEWLGNEGQGRAVGQVLLSLFRHWGRVLQCQDLIDYTEGLYRIRFEVGMVPPKFAQVLDKVEFPTAVPEDESYNLLFQNVDDVFNHIQTTMATVVKWSGKPVSDLEDNRSDLKRWVSHPLSATKVAGMISFLNESLLAEDYNLSEHLLGSIELENVDDKQIKKAGASINSLNALSGGAAVLGNISRKRETSSSSEYSVSFV